MEHLELDTLNLTWSLNSLTYGIRSQDPCCFCHNLSPFGQYNEEIIEDQHNNGHMKGEHRTQNNRGVKGQYVKILHRSRGR